MDFCRRLNPRRSHIRLKASQRIRAYGRLPARLPAKSLQKPLFPQPCGKSLRGLELEQEPELAGVFGALAPATTHQVSAKAAVPPALLKSCCFHVEAVFQYTWFPKSLRKPLFPQPCGKSPRGLELEREPELAGQLPMANGGPMGRTLGPKLFARVPAEFSGTAAFTTSPGNSGYFSC